MRIAGEAIMIFDAKGPQAQTTTTTDSARLSAVSGPSLSLLEKYLLKRGFFVRDVCDPRDNVVWTVCSREGLPGEVRYPNPHYHHLSRDRAADLQAALASASVLLGVPDEALAAQVAQIAVMPPAGFACRLCGVCCESMSDAFRGRVSYEEVAAWREMGLYRILRLVGVEERGGYTLYTAWKNPKNGKHFKRCPWLRRLPGGQGRGCAIYEHRPFKCRSFPYSRDHAERSHCRAFEYLPCDLEGAFMPVDRDNGRTQRRDDCGEAVE
jgi:Fe-S-cluster containining protein